LLFSILKEGKGKDNSGFYLYQSFLTRQLLFSLKFPNFATVISLAMQYILFDTDSRNQLLPFTHTRPTADIRCGILTARERWEMLLENTTATLTESYLQPAFPLITSDDNIYINGATVATTDLLAAIHNLKNNQALQQDNIVLAIRTSAELEYDTILSFAQQQCEQVNFSGLVTTINQVWDIFSKNEQVLRLDFELLTNNKTSALLPEYVTAIGKHNIFIEAGAKIFPCIINAEAGPVYIGKDAEIMEGAIIRGPFALGEHATLKMGAKVYGGTTIGPSCKVGGEISNVVFFANSNKGHDGFLGNAVIGEWCNLGADTNCSNLKNNYDEVKVWSEQQNKSVKTGLQFCGLLMGDHSKCGINTMFNTGTVAGVACNIYGGGFPPTFVPSFSWGGGDNMVTHRIEKALDTANRMMARRNKNLSQAEVAVLEYIFSKTEKQRALFN